MKNNINKKFFCPEIYNRIYHFFKLHLINPYYTDMIKSVTFDSGWDTFITISIITRLEADILD